MKPGGKESKDSQSRGQLFGAVLSLGRTPGKSHQARFETMITWDRKYSHRIKANPET